MENNMHELQIAKPFKCFIETLYQAWTSPEELKQWWRPLGKQLSEVQNDLTVGGEVKFVFEGEQLVIDGNYEEVTPQKLLVYTWNWHFNVGTMEDTAFKLAVRFDGDEHHSAISISQTGFGSKDHIHPHKQGWEQGLQQLELFLSHRDHANDVDLLQRKPAITGYNETPEQAKVGGG
jgi:uncharacterized protein YndB with AHSA1/START domain